MVDFAAGRGNVGSHLRQVGVSQESQVRIEEAGQAQQEQSGSHLLDKPTLVLNFNQYLILIRLDDNSR